MQASQQSPYILVSCLPPVIPVPSPSIFLPYSLQHAYNILNQQPPVLKNSCRQLYLHLLHIHLLVLPVINDMDHSNIIYNILPVIHIHTYSAASPYDDVKYPSVHSLKIPPAPYPHYCKSYLTLYNLLLISLSFFHEIFLTSFPIHRNYPNSQYSCSRVC